MNPNSQYYLAFNLGYPNAYDRSLQRTGDALMVHGKCKSVGCYAMTDALIEEIFGLAREALKGGQESFEVHAFPFRMSDENMARYKDNPNYTFWQTMKQGYDYFEKYRLPPAIAVCDHKYVVNVRAPVNAAVRPDAACPQFTRPVVAPFVPKPTEQQIAEERIVVPGPKLREMQSFAAAKPTPATHADGSFGTSFGLGMQESSGSNPPPTSPQ
jgi:murein L,D-transpeptidase YafK